MRPVHPQYLAGRAFSDHTSNRGTEYVVPNLPFGQLKTDESQFLDGWSYFRAALGGPVNVLLRGFPKPAAVMLAISIVLVAAAAALVFAVVVLVNDSGAAIDHCHSAHAGGLYPPRLARRLLTQPTKAPPKATRCACC